MKKYVLYTTSSALLLTIVGVVSAYVGQPTLFKDVVGNITNLFPEHWIVLIPPAVAVLFIILNFIGKGVRRVRRVCAPLGLLVSTVAYLLVAPSAYLEFIVPNTPPAKLLFATGAGFVLFAFLELLILTFVDTFGRKKVKEAKVEEAEPEKEAAKPEEVVAEEEVKEEPVHEEPVVEEKEEQKVEEPAKKEDKEEKIAAPAPVEYLDKEVEDEEDLEVETEEEAKVRTEENQKAKASRAKKTAAPKAKEKEAEKEPAKKEDKDYDRIYHIMKRAKDDRWIVKIAQSRKAIKIFDTQKEAIAYAEVLASNNNGVVRIFASKGANKGRIIS